MADTGQPKLVKAVYNFKGTNNDELCFAKGDLITVTQVLDGGWWEGTLKGLTGWFPSNYVKEFTTDNRAGATSPLAMTNDVSVNKRESVFYHNVVLQSLIDSERTLVSELQKLIQTYLRPLHTAMVLSAKDYNCLVGNLEDIASLHNSLLTSLDECSKLPMDQQRIGGLFLETASPLKNMYESYCANHPYAANILAARKDELHEFMETNGTTVMKFTSSLSKPFTRLDKYPNLLKELHRHTDEGHVDRGDTQRAISVYRDIALHCNEVRKQKQMEFEILSSPIQGWEGQDIRDLGQVLHMSFARIHSENGETKERLVLLFPGLLVMLSISPRMSGYLFEGKFPVSGMIVESIEDSDVDHIINAFQISGSLIDKRIVCCNTSSQQLAWIEAIRQEAKHGPSHPPTKPQTLQISSSSQPSVSTLSKAKTARVYNDHMHSSPAQKMTWSLSCLRPSPPIRPNLTAREDLAKSPKVSRKTSFRKKPERAHSEDDYYYYKRNDARYLEDDSDLLKVIEAYCSSTKARQTVNSSAFDAPHVIIAEDEKIIIERQKGNEIIVEEKSLVDTVYSLREEIKDVKSQMKKLSHSLEEERRARKNLEKMFKKFTIATRASQAVAAAASGMTSSGMTSSGMSLSSTTTSGMSSSIGASGLINSILDAKLEEGLSA